MVSTEGNQNRKIFTIEPSIAKESYHIFKTSFQIALTLVFEVCIETITTMFLGHLQDANVSQILAGTSIAKSFMNVFCCSIVWGSTSALWTLIPQAVGSNNTHLIKLYIQRGFVVFIGVAIPLCICILYNKNILMFFGINNDNEIDWNIISYYCIAKIPWVFPMVTLAILHRITQNLYYNFEVFIIQALTFFISIPLNYLFMNTFNMGYLGGAAVLTTVIIGNVILVILLLMYKGYNYLFKPLSLSQICDTEGMYQYIQLAIPGCIQGWLNWNAREMVVLLTGYVINSATAGACVSIMRGICMIGMVQNGMANAFTIRIGNYIGGNEIMYAKRCIKIQICFGSVLAFIICVCYFVFKRAIVTMFTNDEEIIDLMVNKFVYVCSFDMIVLAINRNIIGIFRAIGYQKISMYIGIIIQYCLITPLQLYLLFGYKYVDNMEMAIYIICILSACGRLITGFILAFILMFYIDWNKVVQESQARIKINNQQLLKKGGSVSRNL